MSQARNINFKILLCILAVVVFLLAMLGIRSLLEKSDLENKREMDELIRQQQALVKVKQDQAVVEASTAMPSSSAE
ncbi:hypothetical protein [Acinetobacter pullicarnis]|uniref:hypothetical protein n=1 Tax=Acinetobacter pullicarnis TaxID=2576829 RepID=UPI001122F116|nr:hypothetical protein [Acinetobacter pullicarnis]